eukprot:scaffold28714_cov18-Tisochrysis_lutea.AAC.1
MSMTASPINNQSVKAFEQNFKKRDEARCAGGRVPNLWSRVAYPSLKPLAAWVADFRMRMAFMESWLVDGEPSSFWISGLFFPQVRLL